MALDAGVMAVTIEFAKDLKDGDWFGKQDPYCIVKCGGQQFRTKTAIDGGKNPVWNETFSFNVINENSIDIEIKDEDVGKDDLLGVANFSLAKARESGSDRLQVPVVSKKSRKQHGFLAISIKWQPNKSHSAQQHHQQPMMMHPGPYPAYAAPPMYAPPPAYYAAPGPGGYAMPPPAPYPAAYYPAPHGR